MLNSYKLTATKIGAVLSESTNVRIWLWLWLWLGKTIDEDGSELEGSRELELDSPSDFTPLLSSVGFADENIGDGLGEAARLILFSVRGSINVVIGAYAGCVSEPLTSTL